MAKKQKSPVETFRAELLKIMPGYDWTVHKTSTDAFVEATGKQSSGFNRLSTLAVTRRATADVVSYEAKSAGYGLHAKWMRTNNDVTLARALRGLQDQYLREAATLRAHAESLERGRKSKAAV